MRLTLRRAAGLLVLLAAALLVATLGRTLLPVPLLASAAAGGTRRAGVAGLRGPPLVEPVFVAGLPARDAGAAAQPETDADDGVAAPGAWARGRAPAGATGDPLGLFAGPEVPPPALGEPCWQASKLRCTYWAGPTFPQCCCVVPAASRGPNATANVCLPTFIVIGAQKSGSTALFGHFLAHPQFRPPRRKELHFLEKCVRARPAPPR